MSSERSVRGSIKWSGILADFYHALQFSVKKLFSHGLTINASYTWSHVLDEGSGISEGLFFNGNDPLRPRSAYGSSGFDRTHVFIINYTYLLHLRNLMDSSNTSLTTGDSLE
jgi:hypothetical protein